MTVAPYLDAKNFHDVTVVAGDRVKFDLAIYGEPAPEVEWTREGSGETEGLHVLETTRDRNILVSTTETHTKLAVNSITKGLAGKYTVTVRNESGVDSAKVEVRVLGRPSAPESLQAAIEGSKCNLLWKRSKDDGGAPIVHYQVVQPAPPMAV